VLTGFPQIEQIEIDDEFASSWPEMAEFFFFSRLESMLIREINENFKISVTSI
jgi:hypothetical protein